MISTLLDPTEGAASVDGHDVVYLTKVMNDLKNIPGPKLLHIKTKKGKLCIVMDYCDGGDLQTKVKN